MSVALLSQAKKSECGISQPNSSIDVYNVLTERYARTTAKNHGRNQCDHSKNLGQTHTQTHTQTDTHTHEGVCRVAPQLKIFDTNKQYDDLYHLIPNLPNNFTNA